MPESFLFGAPCLPRVTSARGHRPVLILGAYPSALHARWILPDGHGTIEAVAVDNEPVPFWSGNDLATHVQKWQRRAKWKPEWGELTWPLSTNGSSGLWVDENVIRVLGVQRSEVWLTDALDTYRMSDAIERRLNEIGIRRLINGLGIPPAKLRSHPSESAIVTEGLEQQADRIRAEIAECAPDMIVTLGNATLRVLREIYHLHDSVPGKLSSDPSIYGRLYDVHLGESTKARLLPLAHPGAPRTYQDAHERWIETVLAKGTV